MLPEKGRVGSPLLVGLAVLGVLGAAIVTFGQGWNPIALDYGVFWTSVRRPIAEIYQFRIGAVFAYPPTLITLLQPFGLVAFWPGFILWTLLSLVAFFFASKRLVDTRTAILAMFSSASVQNLLLGQTSMLLGACLLFALSLESTFLTGVLIGFLAAIKPQLFLMAPIVMVVRRDWYGLVGMGAGGLTTGLVTIFLYGIQPWLDWLDAIPSFGRAIVSLDVIHNEITLTSVGLRLGLYPLLWWLGGSCVALFAVLRLSRKTDGIYLAALILGSSTLAAPYALTHDLCGGMPAVAALLLSSEAALISITGAIAFIGLGLPLILPLAALFASFRAGHSLRLSGRARGLAFPP